ncbi:unnamed protein product [Schistocephalus solidus]|uniref:C2H2-type domain-containing protein n=1 Tax=Schistocephalus solidus TaxID=70667 RepID=A0A183T677_SCHSO|nr:unnamed protein product [Schistocephalus solidus]
MLLWSSLTGTQLSPVAPRSWVLPSGHTPGNRHDRRAKPETGEPVPGEPKHNRDRLLHCPHCPRAFTDRMGLFGHLRIHDSGIHRNADNTDTPCLPSAPAILTVTATPTTINDILQPIPIFPAHTVQPQLQLTHRPGQSPANPWHGGW